MKRLAFVLSAALLTTPAWGAAYLDMFNLSQDPTFQNRVMAASVQQCIIIGQEDPRSVALHAQRQTYCFGLEGNPTAFKLQLALNIATDVGVIGDATVGSTVSITSGNAATQAALVTDAHILGAFQGQFNTYFQQP